ncbi:alpha/beta fold hydrolase [Rathayibacter sp. YIM 133350]|uniref:RBBP9/YdeN family alpha/beta hydrolase n=1 Tax=Rathayibacter sp. YIM 133350 TaxID=3131992 RepID=UPI00307D7D8A
MSLVMVPGIGGSGTEHWQSVWERGDATAIRIAPAGWDAPDLEDWLRAIDTAVARSVEPTVLVAHSLGTLAATEWLRRGGRAAGAFLVAAPDDHAPAFPAREASTFVGLTRERLRVPALLVASSDDPYASVEASSSLASQWGATLIVAGPIGHINSASGLGGWRPGRDMLTAFVAAVSAPGADERFNRLSDRLGDIAQVAL